MTVPALIDATMQEILEGTGQLLRLHRSLTASLAVALAVNPVDLIDLCTMEILEDIARTPLTAVADGRYTIGKSNKTTGDRSDEELTIFLSTSVGTTRAIDVVSRRTGIRRGRLMMSLIGTGIGIRDEDLPELAGYTASALVDLVKDAHPGKRTPNSVPPFMSHLIPR